MCGIDRSGITAEGLEHPFNDCRLLDAGDDPQPAAAVPAGLDIDGKNASEALRLSLIARYRSVGAALPRLLVAVVRGPGTIRARSGLAGANTPWYRARCARGFGTSATSRAITNRQDCRFARRSRLEGVAHTRTLLTVILGAIPAIYACRLPLALLFLVEFASATLSRWSRRWRLHSTGLPDRYGTVLLTARPDNA